MADALWNESLEEVFDAERDLNKKWEIANKYCLDLFGSKEAPHLVAWKTIAY